jgi:hypothetical protein
VNCFVTEPIRNTVLTAAGEPSSSFALSDARKSSVTAPRTTAIVVPDTCVGCAKAVASESIVRRAFTTVGMRWTTP